MPRHAPLTIFLVVVLYAPLVTGFSPVSLYAAARRRPSTGSARPGVHGPQLGEERTVAIKDRPTHLGRPHLARDARDGTNGFVRRVSRDVTPDRDAPHEARLLRTAKAHPTEVESPFGYVAPRLALLGLAACCGANFPVLHSLEQAHPAAQTGFVRFGLASLPFLPNLAKSPPALALAGLEIGAWCSLGYIAQAVGLTMTSATKGAFICALFTVISPLAESAGLSGRPKQVPWTTWAAVPVALAGTALLEMGGGGGGGTGLGALDVNAGDLWCLGGAVGFGVMFARMEAHMGEFGDRAAELTAWQCVAVTAAFGAWSAFEGSLPASAAEAWALASDPLMVFSAVVATSLVLFGQTACQKYVAASETSIIFASEPVFAAAAAFVLLGERLAEGQMAGAALIVAACASTQLPALLKAAGASDDER